MSATTDILAHRYGSIDTTFGRRGGGTRRGGSPRRHGGARRFRRGVRKKRWGRHRPRRQIHSHGPWYRPWPYWWYAPYPVVYDEVYAEPLDEDKIADKVLGEMFDDDDEEEFGFDEFGLELEVMDDLADIPLFG